MNTVEAETAVEAAHRIFAKELCEGGYSLAGCHRYNAADGIELFRAVRLQRADGDKIIRPIHRRGLRYEVGRPERPPAGWQLYVPPFPLIETDPVFVVEGEKCANELAELGLVARTSGSASSASSADWSPLRGRSIAVWPDNDDAGRRYAAEVSRILYTLGCTVRMIDVAALNLPEHGDSVDWLAVHPDAAHDDVRALATVTDHGNPAAEILNQVPGPRALALNDSGEKVLADVSAFLLKFVCYPSDHARDAHALWVVHTHLMDVWDSTPRLAFLSPEPGSGKSRALEVSALLVPRPVEAVNVTPAYLFRKVASDEGRPTILYDEIDTVFGPKAKENEEIRGLLNAGHRKHSKAGRCVVRGKEVFTEEIPAYCAVALAGLGGLPDTIFTRCVIIRMRRRSPSEAVEPFRHRIHSAEGESLALRVSAWADSVASCIVWPNMPDGIADRDADVWEPLIAVADAAGGDWPARARAAAVALVTESRRNAPSLGIRLLADIRCIFADAQALSTETLLHGLHQIEESFWGDLRGKALDARGLSHRLRPYGIAPRTVRIGNVTAKGYRREDMHDAWLRYLPDPGSSVTSVTAVTAMPDELLM